MIITHSNLVFFGKLKDAGLKIKGYWNGGRYWSRTSDLMRVMHAL